jgi:hypothetical protein
MIRAFRSSARYPAPGSNQGSNQPAGRGFFMMTGINNKRHDILQIPYKSSPQFLWIKLCKSHLQIR